MKIQRKTFDIPNRTMIINSKYPIYWEYEGKIFSVHLQHHDFPAPLYATIGDYLPQSVLGAVTGIYEYKEKDSFTNGYCIREPLFQELILSVIIVHKDIQTLPKSLLDAFLRSIDKDERIFPNEYVTYRTYTDVLNHNWKPIMGHITF